LVTLKSENNINESHAIVLKLR